MGLLNLENDGLPSVLIALVRALRCFGGMPRDELLAICCPPTLQTHTSTFTKRRLGASTLTRWTQLGLFLDDGDRIELHSDVGDLPEGGLAEINALAPLLRRLALDKENNRELNVEGGALGADLSLALSWGLAQDVFKLPGGAYKLVESIEVRQFGASMPYAFRNDTRWNGFRAWAPLLGFGWTEADRGNTVLVIDPTVAVRETLPVAFNNVSELPIEDLLRHLADVLPVLDGGEYRQRVEARLATPAWRATRPHEISVSLSMALKRLETAGWVRLKSRADAPKRTLLGRNHRKLEQISHVIGGERINA